VPSLGGLWHDRSALNDRNSQVSDDLFTPTVSTRASDLPRPWRVDSLLFPAFFGGPLAGTVLGLINGRRLGIGSRSLIAIAVTGLAVIATRISLIATLDIGSALRVITGLAGVAVWGVILATQRRRFRAFQLTGGEPASLVWPGIAVGVAGLIVETVIGLMFLQVIK
jgi:hypothetical protein